MAYNSSTGTISQPVSINDVQRALVTTENDLGQLCMHKNINMWSEFKPIYNTKVTQLTAEDWKGRTHNPSGYMTGGGILKYAPVGKNYFTNIDTNTGNPESKVWTHDKPVLGESAFRLTDFSGYHQRASNVVAISSAITNLKNIPIPSFSGGEGTEISFLMTMTAKTGSITPLYLFGDCENFYPAVILSYGSGTYNYVKALDQTVRELRNGTSMTASVRVDTGDFAEKIAAQMGGSSPFERAPLRSGSKWTACMVLVSYWNFYRIVDSTNVQIVRLEYAKDVDRWTLPVLQSKFNIISSMKAHLGLRRRRELENNNYVYEISALYVDAQVESTSEAVFTVTATLTCHIGTVSVSGVSGTTNVDCGYISFSGQTGTIRKTISINKTTYIITNTTTAGNQMCGFDLTVHGQTIGDFTCSLSINAEGGPEYPYREADLF